MRPPSRQGQFPILSQIVIKLQFYKNHYILKTVKSLHNRAGINWLSKSIFTVFRLHPPESPNLHKSGSLTQLIGDRMRREMKRAESMKVDLKKPKRTPSFTTRRRTQSFRKLHKLDQMEELPPVEVNGYLERKQELQSGGKKAPVRSWKTFYTGQHFLLLSNNAL